MGKVAGRLVILKRQFSTTVTSIKPQIPYEVTQKIIKTLFIHTPEDWYNVPYSYLKVVKGKDVADAVKQYPTVETLAQAIHPEHQWDQSKFASFKGKFGPQTFLERVVRSLFPNEQIQRNAREATGIIGSKYHYLEIDIFIPSLNLGFEYQDPHHYFHSTYGLHTLSEYQSRDAEKHKQAKEKGLTIINVPFWWDWNPDSLLATIKHKRPDLLKQLQTDTPPINEELPQKVLDKWNFDIPELGLPMLALYMPQVRSFDPENWWIFEKYDGMRAVWNSLRRQMYSRWGTPLNIPNYIRDSLPAFWLDGEIWFGREKNTRYLALKINERTSTARVAWDRFLYMVFDAPQPNLLTSPYSDRYAFLEKMVPPENMLVKLAPYHICIGRDHLETLYFHIRAQEGEGVIVRHPDAVYINGYSRYIFKHRGYNDAEALVLEKKPYGNVYVCRIHKLHLYHNMRGNKETDGEANDKEELEENGKEEEEKTEVTSDTENTTKKTSPYYDMEMTVDETKFGDTSEIAVGKFVSFYYSGEISGRGPPLNPKIYGVRNDVTSWEQLLHDKKPKLHQRIWKPTAPVNDWTPQNQRIFLNKFAQERGFDPLVAANWYKIEASEIGAKIGRGLLNKYNDSLIKCLVAVYPEVDFDLQKFKVVPSGHWQNKENKKKFFDQFAKDRGFDPLSAEDWYKIELREVLEKKGGGVLRTYKNSLSEALQDIYPTISLEKHGFSRAPVHYWNSQENQKRYLLDYSKNIKFDALQPKNWYSILPKQIHADKGLVAISRAHGSSFARALLTLFPDLPWDISKFPVQKWETKEEIRSFFDNFAKRWRFDPKVPDNWYTVTRASVIEAKGGRVLALYQQSLVAALMDIYPEIGLQREKFKFATRSFLKLFQGLAKLKQFDAKDKRKWYNVTADDIFQYPGGGEIKTIFPTYAAALLHNFPQIGLDSSKLDPSLHQPLNVTE